MDFLRGVEAGTEILVTRRGRLVARIVPVQTSGERQLTPEQEAAHARTMERLREDWDLGGGKFNRDELYDDIVSDDRAIECFSRCEGHGDKAMQGQRLGRH